MEQRAAYLGIDVGGSSVKVGICTSEGKILAKKTVALAGFSDERSLGREMRGLCGEAGIAPADVGGIGFAVPSIVREGKPLRAFNSRLPFDDIVGWLGEVFPAAPVRMLNDANAAALGEGWMGSASGEASYALVTLGTGIGCGLVFDGKLWQGASGGAGEAGHLCIERDGRPCNCGGTGCFEQYASARGLVQTYRELAGASAQGEDGLQALDVVERCRVGEASAAAAIEAYGRDLGVGLASIARLVDPGVILVGGGVSKSFDLFAPAMRVAFEQHLAGDAAMTEIRSAALGNDAGIVGAAFFAME